HGLKRLAVLELSRVEWWVDVDQPECTVRELRQQVEIVAKENLVSLWEPRRNRHPLKAYDSATTGRLVMVLFGAFTARRRARRDHISDRGVLDEGADSRDGSTVTRLLQSREV